MKTQIVVLQSVLSGFGTPPRLAAGLLDDENEGTRQKAQMTAIRGSRLFGLVAS
jgi:hypothetical protein